jgi:GMP synthase PP-ATPase subunit
MEKRSELKDWYKVEDDSDDEKEDSDWKIFIEARGTNGRMTKVIISKRGFTRDNEGDEKVIEILEKIRLIHVQKKCQFLNHTTTAQASPSGNKKGKKPVGTSIRG